VAAFLLVHSPLGAPYTWEPVARELTELGARCAVPTLTLEPDDDGHYWPTHVDELVAAAEQFESSVVLVAHSGAGPLLPEVAARMGDGAAGVVFVDAGLPSPGMSRLKAFGDDDEAKSFRARAVDGMVPPFPDDLLAKLIEDEAEFAAYIASQRPMPLAIYEEALPTTDLPPLPAAYLQFSAAYDRVAAEARSRGWRYRQLKGSHFHLLDHPREVALTLLGWFK
jgi:pimeloyl-ACP methyl ester carboxylesterase